jgi:hypothetical protein
MGADIRMIPRESALFSSVCKPSLLGVVPWQAAAQASAPQVPWFVFCLWLQLTFRTLVWNSEAILPELLKRGEIELATDAFISHNHLFL